jgi:hypothetical protein
MVAQYVKGIFAGGNGEWDSSTYIMFTMNGLMNIYDFSPDEEARLIAKAGLDWFSTAYALKYRDGIFAAPHQRGFAHQPHGTISDQTGYLWFGSNAPITPQDTRGWRYTSHPGTSGYRPNAVIVNLARKDLPGLPATFRNTKPNYWGTTGGNPRRSVYHETVHLGETFTLSSLWNGHGGQISRMSLIIDSPEGGVAFSGGHPRRSDNNGNRSGLGYARWNQPLHPNRPGRVRAHQCEPRSRRRGACLFVFPSSFGHGDSTRPQYPWGRHPLVGCPCGGDGARGASHRRWCRGTRPRG